MKKLWIALLLAVPIVAQENAGDELLKMYIEAAKPVPEHERLASLEGTWKITSRFWFDPAAAPKTALGTGKGTMILGRRFMSLETDVKGSGAESIALNILGFDRRTNDYTIVSFDTLGTYYVTGAGKWDDALRGIVMSGSYMQPPTGKDQQYRFVWRTPSKREHLFTIEFLMDGKWIKVGETELRK